MSAQGGFPYLGSTISLISKSDMKYVGKLVQVDSVNSTVTLQNVCSYGTEDRAPPGQEVPPSDKIFEYIVFRGSDIKDLHVQEIPQQNRFLPNDPAIIAAHGPPPNYHDPGAHPGYGGFPPQQRPPSNQGPYYRPPPMMSHSERPPEFSRAPPPGPPVELPKSSGAPSPGTNQPTMEKQGFSNMPSVVKSTTLSQDESAVGNTSPTSKQSSHQRTPLSSGRQPLSKVGMADSASTKEKENDKATILKTQDKVFSQDKTSAPQVSSEGPESQGQNQTSFHHRRRGRGGYHQYHHPGGRGGRNTTTGHGHHRYPQAQPLNVPQTDFDFETANAKLNKDEVAKELKKTLLGDIKVTGSQESQGSQGLSGENVASPIEQEIVTPQGEEPTSSEGKESFYDSKSSFFDNISCDLKDRNSGDVQRGNPRARHQEERKINLETFGRMSIREGGRGRGYGGRGRGYGRGGRGRGRGYYHYGNANGRGNYGVQTRSSVQPQKN